MKKYLLNYRAWTLVLVMALGSVIANAQRTASVSGNWNNIVTWGGQPVPTSSDDVVINNGITVTVTADGQCNSVTFRSATGTLSVNSGVTLAVTGAVTLENAASGVTAAAISGAGSIACGSLSIGGTIVAPNLTNDGTTTLTSTISSLVVTGNLSMRGVDDGADDNNATLNLQSGRISVSGTVVLNEDNGSTVNLTLASGAETGTLSIAGSTPFTITGTPTFTPDGGGGSNTTVIYDGGAQTVRATTYRNLVLAGTGSKTMTGVTVSGKISIQGTATAGTTFTYSTAILEYKGNAAQTTGNELPTNLSQVDEIIIDNPSGVALHAARSYGGDVTLTSGYLSTTPTNLLSLTTAGTITTANGAFVNGPLAKAVNSSTTFTFPVGTTTGGLRSIGITTTSGTGTSTFQARFFSADPKTSVANGSNLGTVPVISGCEYWDLARSGGSRVGRVTLSWPAAANSCGSGAYVGNTATLVVAHHNGTNWTDEGQLAGSATGSPSAGGTITSNFVQNSFSPFVLATTNGNDNPLPVMFADVKAFQKGSGVQVEWSNLTERDLVKYEVQRSTDGQNFTTIQDVAPRSNFNDKESYSVYDASPIAGVNFYRIRVTEITAKIIYSKLMKVDISGKQGMALYPNPVDNGQLSLSLTAGKGQYSIRVINMAGQQVYSQNLNHQGGSFTQNIDLSGKAKPGTYSLIVTGENFKQSKTFVVQ